MGIVIKWKTPDLTIATYNLVHVFRSSEETGTYADIATQASSTQSYFDYAGTSTNWYKIRFYQTSTSSWSEWSNAIKGGSWIGFCTPDDVRTVCDVSTTDLTDNQLYDMITFAQTMFTKEIFSKVTEESVEYIDDTRQNKIDSLNTRFYVRRSFQWFLGDMDSDGEVNTDDVEVWEYDSTTDSKSRRTVSSVNALEGYVELESPPITGRELTITYLYGPVDVVTPEPVVKLATAQLAAATAFTKLTAQEFDKMSIGKLSLARTSKPFDTFYNQYRRTLELIRRRMTRRTDTIDPTGYSSMYGGTT